MLNDAKTDRNNEILSQWIRNVWSVPEIAELHKLNPERVRTIVATALRRRGLQVEERGDLRKQLAEIIVGMPERE